MLLSRADKRRPGSRLRVAARFVVLGVVLSSCGRVPDSPEPPAPEVVAATQPRVELPALDDVNRACAANADREPGPLFPFRESLPGGLWGYIDREGCVAIEASFLAAGPFVEGRALVGPQGGGTAIIDPTGAQLATVSGALDEDCVGQYWFTESPEASPSNNAFHDGMLAGCHGRVGEGFYDSEARFVPLALEGFGQHHVEGFVGGLARVETRHESGGYRRVVYVGVDGRPATPFFEAGSTFSDGLALVRGDRIGYVDPQGLWVSTPDQTFLGDFSDGLAFVHGGCIDRSGELVFSVDPTGEYFAFREGLARFRHGHTFGFLDRAGSVAITARYEGARDFSGGLAAVTTGAGWGYIGPDGTMAIDPHFEMAGPHVDGLARVAVPDPGHLVDPQPAASSSVYREGYVDTTGRWIRAWWEVAEVVEGTLE